MALSCLATVAYAQTTTIQGDTTGGPTWNRPHTPTALSGVCTACNFRTFDILLLDPATFRAEIIAPTSFDTFLHVYQGGFDPTDQFKNLVALDDDAGSGFPPGFSEISVVQGDGPFSTGQHIVVVSSFGDGQFGSFTLELDGALFITLDDLQKDIEQQLSIYGFLLSEAQFSGLSRVTTGSLEARAQARTLQLTGQDSTLLDTPSGRLSGGVHVWSEVGHRQTETDVSANAQLSYIKLGTDFGITKDLVPGVAVGSASGESDTANSSTEGFTVWVQPYLGFDYGILRGKVSFAAGITEYDDIVTLAGNASARGATFSGHGFITHDMALMERLVLSPFASATVGTESLRSFGGVLAGQPSQSRRFVDAALGAELSRGFSFSSNGALVDGLMYARAELQYAYSDTPELGFSGANLDQIRFGVGLAAGVTFEIADDIAGTLEADVYGLGLDVVDYGGRGQLVVGF